jgi:N utilization substance protein B
MTVSHQKFREILLVVLFSKAFYENDQQELKKLIMKELKCDPSSVNMAIKKIDALMEHIDQIDATIASASSTFDLHRIQKVELAILRLIAYELLYEKSLEKSVLIAEAKRLAKKFCAPEAVAFCQGITLTISKQ